jgi:hypothetical protein
MVDKDQITKLEDEIIFSARYSPFRVWIMVMVVALLPMWLLFRVCYLDLLRGKYMDAFIVSVLPLLMLLVTLDSIFFKELLFYQDRVVKVWHLFGRRTIYYSAGKVVDPPHSWRWIFSYHHIRETRIGKNFVIQIPILYIAWLFPSAAAAKIETIMDYLTQDIEDNPRNFKRATLPKEVTFQ